MQWPHYRWIKHVSKICIFKDICHYTAHEKNQAIFLICEKLHETAMSAFKIQHIYCYT